MKRSAASKSLSVLATLSCVLLCGAAGSGDVSPVVAAEPAGVELTAAGNVTAPAVVKRDQPFPVNHPPGAKVQAIYVAASGEWAFLADGHFIRGETRTILAAPPATYLLTIGDSTILRVVGDEPEPRPRPRPEPSPDPRPDPGPQPDPTPDPDPEPGPAPIVAEWAVWIEEQRDRAKNVGATAVMTDARVRRDLEDRGLKVRLYDDDESDHQWLIDAAGDVRPAFLLFEDRGVPRVFPAPTSAEALEQIIRENVVR